MLSFPLPPGTRIRDEVPRSSHSSFPKALFPFPEEDSLEGLVWWVDIRIEGVVDQDPALIEDVTGELPPGRLSGVESVEGEEVSQYKEEVVSEILLGCAEEPSLAKNTNV